MGTPGYAATILENIATQHQVVAVYTRPDAIRKRGNKLVESPVKSVARKLGVPVHCPRTLRDDIIWHEIASYEPDVICVAAYGLILPTEVLSIPPYGCLNVHASLLPEWRGAAPIERAILAGDEYTGVCIMRMEEGLDTGDVCVVRTTEIGAKGTIELTAELAELGSSALLTALALIEAGTVEWTPQDDFFSTYAEKVGKHEFYLHPSDSTRLAARKVQASSPAHPARCFIGQRRVTIVAAHREPSRLIREKTHVEPGQAILFQKKLYLCLSDGVLAIDKIKPDGKQTMQGHEFAAGIQGIKTAAIEWGSLDV